MISLPLFLLTHLKMSSRSSNPRYPVTITLQDQTTLTTTVSFSFPKEYTHLNKQSFNLKGNILLTATTSLPTPEIKEDYVYLINIVGTTQYKIGKAINPSARRQTLKTGNPLELKEIRRCLGGLKLERQLHKKYNIYRGQGEWFTFDEVQFNRVVDDFERGSVDEVEDDLTDQLEKLALCKGLKQVQLVPRKDLQDLLSEEYYTSEEGLFTGCLFQRKKAVFPSTGEGRGEKDRVILYGCIPNYPNRNIKEVNKEDIPNIKMVSSRQNSPASRSHSPSRSRDKSPSSRQKSPSAKQKSSAGDKSPAKSSTLVIHHRIAVEELLDLTLFLITTEEDAKVISQYEVEIKNPAIFLATLPARATALNTLLQRFLNLTYDSPGFSKFPTKHLTLIYTSELGQIYAKSTQDEPAIIYMKGFKIATEPKWIFHYSIPMTDEIPKTKLLAYSEGKESETRKFYLSKVKALLKEAVYKNKTVRTQLIHSFTVAKGTSCERETDYEDIITLGSKLGLTPALWLRKADFLKCSTKGCIYCPSEGLHVGLVCGSTVSQFIPNNEEKITIFLCEKHY
jgi:hypothetical protein